MAQAETKQAEAILAQAPTSNTSKENTNPSNARINESTESIAPPSDDAN